MKNDEIISLFKQASGYLKSTELVQNKIHSSTIQTLLKQGKIERIKRGLYRLPPDLLAQHDFFPMTILMPPLRSPRGCFVSLQHLNYAKKYGEKYKV